VTWCLKRPFAETLIVWFQSVCFFVKKDSCGECDRVDGRRFKGKRPGVTRLATQVVRVRTKALWILLIMQCQKSARAPTSHTRWTIEWQINSVGHNSNRNSLRAVRNGRDHFSAGSPKSGRRRCRHAIYLHCWSIRGTMKFWFYFCDSFPSILCLCWLEIVMRSTRL
jgi:hypothetical protein